MFMNLKRLHSLTRLWMTLSLTVLVNLLSSHAEEVIREVIVSPGSIEHVVFTADNKTPIWCLIVIPAEGYGHTDATVDEVGRLFWVDDPPEECGEPWIFKCNTAKNPVELAFQRRVFTGHLMVCKPKPGVGIGVGPIPPWTVIARADAYFVVPEVETVCVCTPATFRAKDGAENPVESSWTVTLLLGGSPIEYPLGTTVTVHEDVPGIYMVKGTSLASGATDSAQLTVCKVEIISDETDDCILYNTAPLNVCPATITMKLEPSDVSGFFTLQIKDGDTVIRTIVDGKLRAGGTYTDEWDGKKDDGTAAAPGKYTIYAEWTVEETTCDDQEFSLAVVELLFKVTKWKPKVQSPKKHDVGLLGDPPWGTHIPKVKGDTFKLNAKVKVTATPVCCDEIASKWKARIIQNIIAEGDHEVHYTTNYFVYTLVPVPPVLNAVADEKVFKKCGDKVSLSVVDTPGEWRVLWLPLFPAETRDNPLMRIRRDHTFVTWLIVENETCGLRKYLKWVKWRVAYDVYYTVLPQETWYDKAIWIFEIIDQGDGMGPHTPSFVPFSEHVEEYPK